MDWTDRRESFRRILEGDICVHPGSVFDPISARIAQDLGFECGMFAGSVASQVILGGPDIILITLSEFAEQAYRINRAVSSMPLMVDADHGYGNALNVRRTVEELETNGISGLTIEDTDLPQAYGRSGSSSLISVEEGAAKIKSALDARQDSRLVIIARTGAAQITNVEDAIRRAKKYEQVGADAMFFSGIKTKEELAAVAGSVSIPVMLGGSGSAPVSTEELGRLGVRVSLQGHYPFMSAVQGAYNTLKALRDGIPPEQLTDYADNSTMKRLMRDEEYKSWTKEGLGG
jgi:carboxyvinyl-carboxyphosphonate phosphorylmutase